MTSGHIAPTAWIETLMILDADDRRALLEAVREFARSEIAPVVERPELVAGRDAIDGLLTGLADLGVLTGGGDPGLGVWDLIDQPEACGLSIAILGEIALSSPDVAYELHLRGLASALDRLAGAWLPGSSITFEAAAGEAGRLTGTALTHPADLAPGDTALLADVWGPPTDRPRLHVGPPDWQQLWWPEWAADQGWRLRRTPRAATVVEDRPHGHGLDGLAYQHCTLVDDDGATTVDSAVVDALVAHALGLMAISVATARRSTARARTFSTTRSQGGGLIARHDAVAQLLARAEIAVTASAGLLEQAAALPAGVERLRQAWRSRSLCQPLLTAAGSDALQVFGGLGYMRDVGAERDQRDLNTLRRLGGSPPDLVLRCAALDTTAARAS